MLINKKKSTSPKHFADSKAFTEYSNDMDDIYKNIKEHNPNKKRKILIVFNDMIADILSNKKLNPVVTELFIRGRKPSISFFLLHNLILLFQKNIKLKSTCYFIMKIPNKRELQQIECKHSSDIHIQNFINLYKKCSANSYSF